jgi:hypothetical protein
MHFAFCALMLGALCRPDIETTVRTAHVQPNGKSTIHTVVYRYNGRDFLDSLGRPCSGEDTFVVRLAQALRQIEDGGPTGKALVDSLRQSPLSLQIAYCSIDEADMDSGTYVHWNPCGTVSAPDQAGGTHRPPFVGLAHELAHISDVWNGTVNRKTWRVLPDGSDEWISVPYAELYATHVENKIRAENGFPLRVSYASAPRGAVDGRAFADRSSLLLRPGTRKSLYFDCRGHTSYRELRRSERAETY